jgi:acyl-CoA reductase-like NAD-dependent aldehyde dehydrogenase
VACVRACGLCGRVALLRLEYLRAMLRNCPCLVCARHYDDGVRGVAGQICSATSRLLLHKSIAAPFIARLVEETRKITVGPPLEPSTKLGPLVSKSQYEKARPPAAASASAHACGAAGGVSVRVIERG